MLTLARTPAGLLERSSLTKRYTTSTTSASATTNPTFTLPSTGAALHLRNHQLEREVYAVPIVRADANEEDEEPRGMEEKRSSRGEGNGKTDLSPALSSSETESWEEGGSQWEKDGVRNSLADGRGGAMV